MHFGAKFSFVYKMYNVTKHFASGAARRIYLSLVDGKKWIWNLEFKHSFIQALKPNRYSPFVSDSKRILFLTISWTALRLISLVDLAVVCIN